MAKRLSPFLTSFLIGTLLALVISGSAQEADQKMDLPLQHEVTVALKLIQAYVADKSGLPVGDLTQEDFEVLDDGVVQKIKAFENHAGPAPSAAPAVTPGGAGTGLPRTGRKFYFIFDFFRNDPPGLKMGKKAARALVDALQPEDQVALLSFSPRTGLRLQVPPTADKERIKASIEKTNDLTYLKSLDDPKLGLEMSQAEMGLESAETVDLRGLLTDYFGALTDLAKALRTVPGFKNVVLFSLGLPLGLVYGPASHMSAGRLAMGETTDADVPAAEKVNFTQGSLVMSQLNAMSEAMAGANCLIYSVNTEVNRTFLITGKWDFQGRDSLRSLSELTGGRYYDSADQHQAVAASIHNVTKSYYVLGYYVPERQDGRHHQVKVRVKRKGLTVTAQGGYDNPKPFREASVFEKRLGLVELILGAEPSVLPVRALTLPSGKGATGLLLSEVEPSLIPGAAQGKCEIVEAALDANRNIVWSSRGEVSLSSLAAKRAFIYSFFRVPPGDYECKTVVRNLETGEAAVGSASLSIAEPSASGLVLHTPLVLIPDEQALFLKVADSGTGLKDLSLRELYPGVPWKGRPVFEEVAAVGQRIAIVLPTSVVGLASPALTISAALGPAGTDERWELEDKRVAVMRDGQDLICLIEATLPALDPGEYLLELAVEDVNSGALAETSKVLRVKPDER